jgi:PadR family transcriptional regulator PadR
VREPEAERDQAGDRQREWPCGPRAPAHQDERDQGAADADDRLWTEDRLGEVRGFVGAQLVADAPPLREPTLFILTALLPGALHGYGIIKAVEEMSDGRVRLRAGTLYAALDRLENAGCVTLDCEVSEGGPPRRYYRLAPAGVALLEAEERRLAENAKLVRDGLRRARPRPA